MKTIQMMFDEKLLKAVDRVAQKLHTTRSAFARQALGEAIKKYRTAELEKKHRQGYEAHPVIGTEFDLWEHEQAWGPK